MLTASPWPMALGMFITTILAVYIAKIPIRYLLRLDIAVLKGPRIMYGQTLYTLVPGCFLPVYMCLLAGFLWAVSTVPAGLVAGQG